jgi:hypothetical protein
MWSWLFGLLLAGNLLAWPALAFVEAPGEVLAQDACEAFQSFRKRSNPDDARLVPGRRYQVLGRNAPDGDWLQLVVPGAKPAQRWVSARCARLALKATAPPFFDAVEGGRDDPAPPPPPLDAFDRAVLEVCGPWGSRPRPEAFRAMLDRPELADTVQELHEALDRRVRGGPVGLPRFKDELTAVWFEEDGFAHVFCGEPGREELGGLHYRGRYLELQEEGLAGLMREAECRGTEITPPVYTVGVRYRPPGGGPWRNACPKGYAYDLGARDLLLAATRAYRKLRRQRGQAMCVETTGPGYPAVVVVKRDAIRTFYPDTTPRCDAGLSRRAVPATAEAGAHAAGRGTSTVKRVPGSRRSTRQVPPIWRTSAVTIRIPSPALRAGSKPGGSPTPRSITASSSRSWVARNRSRTVPATPGG